MNKKKYLKIFKHIKNSFHDNVQGVLHISSGVQGPIMGITICTHGNEPCGLSVVEKLTCPEFSINRGEVFIVLNNLDATEKYFNATSQKEENSSRFLDINMNRLPKVLDNSSDKYEIRRASELLKIWKKFDVAVDLHSTPQKSKPFIIEGNKSLKEFGKFLGPQMVLTNMLNIQLGNPAISFYGHNDSVSFGLEAGSHHDSSAFDVSLNSILSLLAYFKMIEYDLVESEYNIFKVIDSVIIPDKSFHLVNKLPMFTPIQKGQIIAKNKHANILSPSTGLAILAPDDIIINYNEKEEALFICTKSN